MKSIKRRTFLKAGATAAMAAAVVQVQAAELTKNLLDFLTLA